MALRPKLKQSERDRERVMRKLSAAKFRRGTPVDHSPGRSRKGVSRKKAIHLAGEGRSMPARGKKKSFITKNAGRLLHPRKPKWKK